jgi:hypothetical protein
MSLFWFVCHCSMSEELVSILSIICVNSLVSTPAFPQTLHSFLCTINAKLAKSVGFHHHQPVVFFGDTYSHFFFNLKIIWFSHLQRNFVKKNYMTSTRQTLNKWINHRIFTLGTQNINGFLRFFFVMYGL